MVKIKIKHQESISEATNRKTVLRTKRIQDEISNTIVEVPVRSRSRTPPVGIEPKT